MVSFLRSQFQSPHYAVVFAVLGLVLCTLSREPAQAQAPVIEPVVPTAHVIAYGSGAPLDLTALGPDFSASWLTAALPVLSSGHATPVLMQRVSMERSSGAERRTTYDRAADGRLVARRVERREGTGWRPVQQTTYMYQDGALVAQCTKTWSGGTWALDQRITLERGEDGAVRTVVQQTRHGGQWINEARLTLQPSDSSVHAPDVSEPQRRLVRATWANGAWDRTTRITFTVAEGGGLITQHNETWTGTQWVNSTRLTYMYDGAGYPIEKSLAVWIGDGWTDGPLHFYDYQVHGEQVEQRTETWMGTRRLRTTQATLTYAKPVQVPLLGTASFN